MIRFAVTLLFGFASVLSSHGKPCSLQADPTEETIAIDGVLDENTWIKLLSDESRSASDWKSITSPGRSSFDKRQVFFAWDQENLYVAMQATFGDESELSETTAAGEDSLRIDLKDSALGIVSSGRQIETIMIPYLIPNHAATQENDSGWIAEMARPWAHLRIDPRPGLKIIFNVAGQDMSGDISWAAVRNFRDVENFGILELR